jgi:hypothetical protein
MMLVGPCGLLEQSKFSEGLSPFLSVPVPIDNVASVSNVLGSCPVSLGFVSSANNTRPEEAELRRREASIGARALCRDARGETVAK